MLVTDPALWLQESGGGATLVGGAYYSTNLCLAQEVDWLEYLCLVPGWLEHHGLLWELVRLELSAQLEKMREMPTDHNF